MKRVFLSIILIYIFTNMIIAQEESPKPLVVKEFLISSDAKAVFSEPVEKAYEYFGV